MRVWCAARLALALGLAMLAPGAAFAGASSDASAAPSAARSAAPAGLCQAKETRYFSCPTRAGKWIALCGAAGGGLQYRYGRVRAVELVFPAAGAAVADSFRFAHYARSQTEHYEVSFASAGVRYAVFDYTEEARRTAGVQVQVQGQPERQLLCAGRIYSRVHELADKLPCDRDNALNQGSCR